MARMPWFKLWVDALDNPKIGALLDSEFRLLVYIWGLARRSPIPGTVYVVPGIGVAPADLFAGARCKSGDPETMLARLVTLRLIDRDSAGVIVVRDWDVWNGRPPSKQPSATRVQGQKDRDRKRIGSGDAPDRKLEEETEEEETTKASLLAEDPVQRLQERLSQRLALTRPMLVAAYSADDPEKVRRSRDALRAEIDRLGFDAVLESSSAQALECHRRSTKWPSSLAYFVPRLQETGRPKVPPQSVAVAAADAVVKRSKGEEDWNKKLMAAHRELEAKKGAA